MASLWREAFATFGAHATPMLFFGVMGFAGSIILVVAIGAALRLTDVLHASGPLVTHSELERVFLGHDKTILDLLFIQAIIGMFLGSFARGVISGLALGGQAQAAGTGATVAACRAALSRWPHLLIGSVIYGGLATVGAVGLNIVLRGWRLDLNNAGRIALTFDGFFQALALRSLHTLGPDPGSPFAEFVPYLRHVVLSHSEFHVIGLGSIVFVIVADTLLRFRAITALTSIRPDLFTPVLESIGLGLRHFGAIACHAGLLRMGIATANVALVILPVLLAQSIVVPLITRTTGSSALYMPCLALMIAGSAWMNAVFTAFVATHDARLFASLTRSAWSSPVVISIQGARPTSG